MASTMITTQVVLGSMERAEEYQRVLISLKESAGGQGKVQGEMIDRVLQNGMSTLSIYRRCEPVEAMSIQLYSRNVELA
jgi:hypothetical protein